MIKSKAGGRMQGVGRAMQLNQRSSTVELATLTFQHLALVRESITSEEGVYLRLEAEAWGVTLVV